MIAAGTFKLRNGTMAIFPEKNNHRSVILIPVGASVAVVGGDVERDSFMMETPKQTDLLEFVARIRFYQYSRLTFVVVANESWGNRLRWGTLAWSSFLSRLGTARAVDFELLSLWDCIGVGITL